VAGAIRELGLTCRCADRHAGSIEAELASIDGS
jgi:hypothetical protein